MASEAPKVTIVESSTTTSTTSTAAAPSGATLKPPPMTRSKSYRMSIVELEEKMVSKPQENRKTKIVCTIGPACWEVDNLCQMLMAGMNVARLNFSHGDHKTHGESIRRVREAVDKTGILCGILLDTKGPEIRTGKLKEGKEVQLEAGQTLEIVCTVDPTFEGDNKRIACDYENMPKMVEPGGSIKIGDGLIHCVVQSIRDNVVTVKVKNTAKMGQRKGMNLPGARTDLKAVTDRDVSDLRFGVEQGVDFIAASFVRKPQDVHDIRKVLGDNGKNIKIISKIENQEGLDNFDAILEVSDGIMVARGDLGVEIPIQRVCMAQKMMIRKCNIVGKPVITATQMLESMIENPRPTRAEATDVANAVFDGTDCVMLSGETANGKYPLDAVSIMSQICRTAEVAFDYDGFFVTMMSASKHRMNRAEAITSSAVKTVSDLNAPLIICLTSTGSTGRYLSKWKPNIPVLSLVTQEQTARQLLVSRAIWPVVMQYKENSDVMIREGIALAKEKQWLKSGEEIVVVSGLIHGVAGGTNTLKVITAE